MNAPTFCVFTQHEFDDPSGCLGTAIAACLELFGGRKAAFDSADILVLSQRCDVMAALCRGRRVIEIFSSDNTPLRQHEGGLSLRFYRAAKSVYPSQALEMVQEIITLGSDLMQAGSPLPAQGIEMPPVYEPVSKWLEGSTVLVLDDQPLNTEAARIQLVGVKELFVTSTITEAVEVLERHQIDIVLLDLELPVAPVFALSSSADCLGQSLPLGWWFPYFCAMKGVRTMAVVSAGGNHHSDAVQALHEVLWGKELNINQMVLRFFPGFLHCIKGGGVTAKNWAVALKQLLPR